MLEKQSVHLPQGLRAAINQAYRLDELALITTLCEKADLGKQSTEEIQSIATLFVEKVRKERKKTTGIDSFLTQYSLSSEEGIALMCLAEALLRVPDKATIDSLIKDKLTGINWKSHQGQSDSFFVNATTWALMLTGKILSPEKVDNLLSKALIKVASRSGEGMVRAAVDKAMRIMSKQFVMGRTINEALTRAQKKEAKGYRYSYDMLGEAALTAADAERYFRAYQSAIEAIGQKSTHYETVYQRPGISIKLSALHPRYQETQSKRVMAELPPKLLSLAQLAKKYDIALTVDAEESERLDLSLDVIEAVFKHDSLKGWQGFGLAVQSYQKRAYYVLDWVAALARSEQRRIMVRLIKGAYWDSEIKKTQMQGLSEYPVFTRKAFTDVSFQACAKKILSMTDAIYPQFATHNAYSVAMILSIVGEYRDFEFQCLHGMGKELYECIVPATTYGIPCRIYAPVGTHEDLLPYLVRRLLENGANSSFVNRIVDEKAPIAELIADPVHKATQLMMKINQNIPLPKDLFSPQRENSLGYDLSDRQQVINLQQELEKYANQHWQGEPLIAAKMNHQTPSLRVTSPQQVSQVVGSIQYASLEEVEEALTHAQSVFASWGDTSVTERAKRINQFADLLYENKAIFLTLLCKEAGKTLPDAWGELREAIDFCRYYAALAIQIMKEPTNLKGYTGEVNQLSLHPRGTVLCISPWNFPLAIFTGQIVAALVTGNCVIAKPAEQTSIIATEAIKLLHLAGIPRDVVQLLPGSGEQIGAALVKDRRIKAILFTGSSETASKINLTLAARAGEIIPLIAETGGQNVMLVDSSALLEQVVMDVITSAFGSAGQRCSALRVLYVQEEVYSRTVELLRGAMAELVVGNPSHLSTDVGPVIDEEALAAITQHVDTMKKKYDLIYQCTLEGQESGYFMPPTAIAIDSIQTLSREVFGPVLHVIRFKRSELDKIINQINDTGYGLTLGIHSRINGTINYIRQRVHVGNCYVNRNMIGAVVGLQPFGGEGLSGTGPKAGGPNYLVRLCHERTFTQDTTAAGGNASLMSLAEGL